MSLANTNTQLPDIIGAVRDINITFNDQTWTAQHIMINSVFDAKADQLKQNILAIGVAKVIVATSINPKFVGGNIRCGKGDRRNQHQPQVYRGLYSKPEKDTTSAKQYHGVKKLEKFSLGELNNYALESPPQAIEFLCKAKIASLETTNGWCYISCAKCSKKLQRGNSSFTCPTCFNASAVGVVSLLLFVPTIWEKKNTIARYRVELLVEAGDDISLFVAFDSAMTKLTGIRAAEVAME
ncbi:hypothetical protein YC2023_016944 [Brassica napus]